jgi:hypothetical protein
MKVPVVTMTARAWYRTPRLVSTPVARPICGKDADGVALLEIEAGGALESGLWRGTGMLFCRTGSGGADAGTLGGIEHAALDGGGVRIEGHEAAEGVDFADHVPLARPPTAGLQDIWPTVSAFWVRRRVWQPRRAGGERGLDAGMFRRRGR